jgi:hypothetical protein
MAGAGLGRRQVGGKNSPKPPSFYSLFSEHRNDARPFRLKRMSSARVSKNRQKKNGGSGEFFPPTFLL